jgi:hypothetical protein
MAEAQIEETKRAIIEDGMSFIDNILKKSKNN